MPHVNMMNKICLGSAQFGADYGIANKNGQVEQIEVKKILDYAATVKIDSIDTAIDYGNSEEIIGQYANDRFKIGSKLPSIDPIFQR